MGCVFKGAVLRRPTGELRTIPSISKTPPANPPLRIEKIGETAMPASAIALAIAGHALYAALSIQGLATFDVSDPTRPRLTLHQRGMDDADDVAARVAIEVFPEPDRLIVLDRMQGLSVYSNADPLHPEPLWDLPMPGGRNNQAVSIARHGDAYYLACGGGGLKRLPADFGPESRPVDLFHTFDYTVGVAPRGSRWLLVADNYHTGMQVLDLEANGFPRVVHIFQTGTFCDAIHVLGRHAVAINREFGFSVVDVGDPRNPFLANVHYTPRGTESVIKSSVVWRGRFLLLGNSFGYIQAFDLRRPERPVLALALPTEAEVNAMAIRGDLLFVNYWRLNELGVYRLSLN
jgi:hypothetical protein